MDSRDLLFPEQLLDEKKPHTQSQVGVGETLESAYPAFFFLAKAVPATLLGLSAWGLLLACTPQAQDPFSTSSRKGPPIAVCAWP